MAPSSHTPCVILTTGEPAGIGPDVVIMAARKDWPAQLIALGDRSLLEARANALGIPIQLESYSSTEPARPHQAGSLPLIDIPLNTPCHPGVVSQANASYVLAQLDLGIALCADGEGSALVTAPIHKAVINEAGIPFLGHTEYLANATNTPQVVMMLTNGELKVALATTHLPLAAVPAAITQPLLREVLTVLHQDLETRFGIVEPTISVLGLNPHAGEAGHLGTEEMDIIAPVCGELRGRNMNVSDPLPADSAFIPRIRARTDAYLAMYHDQGLPVLKAMGFDDAVNVTLGLPLIRTSVDHGTALELAATGEADSGSLEAAIQMAISLAVRRANA